MNPNKIDIQIIDRVKFDFFDKESIMSYLKRFIDKKQKVINCGKMNLYIEKHKEKLRGVPSYYCKLKLWTDKGVFFASNQDYGYIPALHYTLLKIEKEITKKKERRLPKIISHQLKKIRRFPAML